MKNIYLFSGGGFVIAHDSAEFVTKMRNSSLFGYSDHDAEFMAQVARRCMTYNEAYISTLDTDSFLRDLITHELVVAINPDLPLRIS